MSCSCCEGDCGCAHGLLDDLEHALRAARRSLVEAVRARDALLVEAVGRGQSSAWTDPKWTTARRVATKDMYGALSDFQAGRISADDLFRRWGRTVDGAFRDAYAAGLRRVGATIDRGGELYLKRALAHEMTFVRRFVDDLVADRVRYPGGPGARLGLHLRSQDSARIQGWIDGDPDPSWVYYWRLGSNEGCPDCALIASMSPYTQGSLPTVPRAGETQCTCLLSKNSKIQARYGSCVYESITIGDEVLTHTGRWKKVLRKVINRSTLTHRYAVVVGESSLFGITDDHLVMTDFGWFTAKEASVAGHTIKRGSIFGLCGLREEKKKSTPTFKMYEMRRNSSSDQVGRHHGKVISQIDERSSLCQVLGRRHPSIDLSFPLAMDSGAWSGTGWICDPSQERRCHRRSAQKSGINAASRSLQVARQRTQKQDSNHCLSAVRQAVFGQREQKETEEILFTEMCVHGATEKSHDCLRRMRNRIREESVGDSEEKLLLSELLQEDLRKGTGDPALHLLRKDLLSGAVQDRKVSVGEIILLQSVFPQSIPLYDLVVEEDESFIADGLILHNSNCKCDLDRVRRKRPTRAARDEIRVLGLADVPVRSLLAPSPTPGLRVPTAAERKVIADLQYRIAYNRRLMSTAPTDEAFARYAAARREANAELIEYMRANDIHATPVLSVDEILTGGEISAAQIEELMAEGLDALTVGTLSKSELRAALRAYETALEAWLAGE